DEGRRTRFAPASRVLAEEYQETARVFFKACRPAMRASAAEMATWAIAAEQTATRQAVLTYLLEGDRARELASALLGQLEGTWIGGLDLSSEILKNLEEHHRLIILAQLGLLGGLFTTPIPPPRMRTPPAKLVLEGLYEWWMPRRDDLILEYETSR